MKSSWTAAPIMLCVACLAVVTAGPRAAGQDPVAGGKSGQAATGAVGDGAFRSLADLEASYSQRMAALERKRLADLTGLAQRLTGADSERVYRAVFDVAVCARAILRG